MNDTPTPRRALHRRETTTECWLRDDGLIDIEGRMRDLTPHGTDMVFHQVAAGDAIHDIQLTLTLDQGLTIRQVRARLAVGATPFCGGIESAYAGLEGLRIGAGFRQQLLQRVGGLQGCTHLTDLAMAIAATAVQAAYALKRDARAAGALARPPGERPAVLDTCHAWRSDGEAARIVWPWLQPAAPASVAAPAIAASASGGSTVQSSPSQEQGNAARR